ncbi:MAG: adenylate kinase [Candidatus Omnitrophica bacterium]|nr:adenylate kinase [Candidatus Omnitrophota bacterium]
MRLVFLGPPGAGKGTQAKLVSERFKIPHISTGDLLREAIKADTSVGREVRVYMDRGELVPDNIVIRIATERLAKPDTVQGFILDGFPRTKWQAATLDDQLKKMRKRVDWVIYFDTSEKVCVERSSGRRVCKSCGANYHIVNMPPRKSDICDVCGGELYQRDDDREDTTRNRLIVYRRQTEDLIEYYKLRSILKSVSGDKSAEAIFSELKDFFVKQGLIK